MKFRYFVYFVLGLALANSCRNGRSVEESTSPKPNVVIIYMDDLGCGDVGVYGSIGLQTPSIDSLAADGILFTRGYSTSATCSPSRYALMTGTYPWRNENARILSGNDPLLIDTAQTTLPSMMKEMGYYTGIVGKWHLGLGNGNVDWNRRISPGPNEVGFDYSYIMAATQDRVPTVYIDNGMVVGLDPDDSIQVSYEKNFDGEPTGIDHRSSLKLRWHHGHNNSIVNGIPRIGFMKGGEKARWVDEEMADHFLAKAKDFVRAHKNDPFFLLYTMQQPHVPRTPGARFAGTTGLGPRGDVIAEADWCIGEFLKTLDEEGLLENTLIIFTSDNGPVLNDGYYDQAVEKLGDHDPFSGFRGGKYSLFEAGTRVPFIVSWKGVTEKSVSDAMVCQLDLYSSLARIIGSTSRTKDSYELSDVFLGKSIVGREELIIEAGSRLAFRQGNFVMIPPYEGPARFKEVNIETGFSDNYQLYDLANDLSQKNNLADSLTVHLEEMLADFEAILSK